MQAAGQKVPKAKDAGKGAQFTAAGEASEAPAKKEKEEDMVTRVLTTQNPNAPQNTVRFSYGDDFKTRAFVRDPSYGQTAFHVVVDGPYEFIDENAHNVTRQRQEEVLRNQFNFSTRGTQTFNQAPKCAKCETLRQEHTDFSGEFSRSLIYDLYKKRQSAQQQQMQQQQKGAKEHGKETHGSAQGQDGLKFAPGEGASSLNPRQEKTEDAAKPSALLSLTKEQQQQIQQSLNLAERLITEKNCDEIISDFLLWDDPADQYQQTGSLFPLWDFVPGVSKPAACIEWHPRYPDMFAVGYGEKRISSTINKKSSIAIYSLKNVYFPEKLLETDSDVVCLAWCPESDNLLLAGLIDGNVCIFDVAEQKLVAKSSTQTGKHIESVTCVGWMQEGGSSELQTMQFISGSFDGYLIQWVFQLGQIKQACRIAVYDTGVGNDIGPVLEEKRELTNFQKQFEAAKKPDQGAKLNADATILINYQRMQGGASQNTMNQQHPLVGVNCLRFNPDAETRWMFALGCDNGLIRLSSTAYTTDFHQSFVQQNNGHHALVHQLHWNRFRADLLAACSEDNYLKIFQVKHPRPLYTYDLQAPAICLQWNHVVSTGLIVGTALNEVHVYDVAQNREKPLCHQKVVPDQARLTTIALNCNYPILAVGDTLGIVRIFKLSPNLRKRSVFVAEKKKGIVQQLTPEEQKKQDRELEVAKIDEYIAWCAKARAANGE